ncbi:MAG: UDP-3-O-(3-hydroxymyristoyl)glucosamine N-acyltransferase [Gammaproteobacteria bacterium]|nr:UDP-3-O-(3-hydroxymyristoyl)glucosamine N-acyltransferase [Gammaproteobacteria bacterium]
MSRSNNKANDADFEKNITSQPSFTLADINQKIGTTLRGDGSCVISTVASLTNAKAGALTFCENGKHTQHLKNTQASAVILTEEDLPHCPTHALISKQPYLSFTKVAALFSHTCALTPGIHPTAQIGQHCVIPSSVYIGPYVIIEDHVTLGEHTAIHAHSLIGHHSQLGAHCILWPRVTCYSFVSIGHHTAIHSGAVIGSDGFGYQPSPEGWQKVPQLGSVVIGNHVEIGANTTIDRGTLEATSLADGVKLDNLIQIAHNVQIGENTAIAACTGISGSTRIGKNCIIAGGVGFAGHLHITDNVTITGMAMVTKSIDEPGLYSSGTGLFTNKEWKKNIVRLRHLNELALRVKALEEGAK